MIWFSLGFILGLILDKVWFHINYSKYEKGFEVIEHYHFGLVCFVFGILFDLNFLFGLGLALNLAEWSQDHFFAYHSDHFKHSTIIGLGIFAVVICSLIQTIIF